MKTRKVQWNGRTVEVSHNPDRYFVTINFIEIDSGGMGIWTTPSAEDRRAFILAYPKLSRSTAWRRTYDAEAIK